MSALPPPPPPPPGYGPPPGYPPAGYPPSGYGGYHPGYPPPGYSYIAPNHATRLGYRPAGFWQRLGAYLLDGLVLLGVMLPLIVLFVIIGAANYEDEVDICRDADGFRYRCTVPTDRTVGIIFLLIGIGFVASLLVGIFYWGHYEGRRGQTIGKRTVGIRTIDQYTGAPIGFGRAVGRMFARILSGQVFSLGYLWMLWDDQKQTWHDKIVKSIVVQT
jgi:uncharacterized RDD family membrane protein YckC